MIMLHVFFTLLLFLPIWMLTDPVLHTKSAWVNGIHTLGTFLLSGSVVNVLATTIDV